MRPLYAIASEPDFVPDRSHAGLWFDKFCNQWCRNPDPEKTGLASWSLTAFIIRNGPDKGDYNPKLDWIRTITHHPVGDSDLLSEHTTRADALARALGGQTLVFKTTSRFASGLGREHPIENGFAWHPVLGVPYLPGSSVKGLVRAWALTWADPKPDPAVRDRIFGARTRKGTVLFLDALPIKPVQLKADVMTPHYGDYYEGKSPPADWLSPNPIPFLTVAPDQRFQFALAPATPDAGEDCRTAAGWLEAALKSLGAGAKTAVGYGRFTRDQATEDRLAKDRKAANEQASFEARLRTLSPLGRELEQAIHDQKWDADKNAFTTRGFTPEWLERLEKDPQPDAIRRLRDLVDRHFPGLLANPDKTVGKKNKPAFKDRQRELAKRLNALPHS